MTEDWLQMFGPFGKERGCQDKGLISHGRHRKTNPSVKLEFNRWFDLNFVPLKVSLNGIQLMLRHLLGYTFLFRYFQYFLQLH